VSDSAGVSLGRGGILAQLGLTTAIDPPTASGSATVVAELCVPGTEVRRTSVIATWADILTGAVAGTAIDPRIPLTLDLEVQLLRPILAGTSLRLEAQPVKVGRTVILCRCRVLDAASDGEVARCFVSFIASPNPAHVWGEGGFPALGHLGGRLEVPLAERIGSRIVQPGTAEVPHRPDGLNASGAIQGGLVAFGAEEAVRTAIDRPTVVDSLVLRYLRPFEIGPAVCVSELVGRGGDRAVVELTDAGSGKLGAVATVRLLAL
jgi:acyl-coenzyme A thioesterase PaaI-like protein